MVVLAQQTYVPDDNFEAYLEANGMGNGIQYDDSVFTSSIDTVTYLNVGISEVADSISDLTGIEDFILLTVLQCSRNKLTTLDVSQNVNLVTLNCDKNKLTNLNINNCINLIDLKIEDNQLTTLDLTTNINLREIEMSGNLVTCLDVSQLSNIHITELLCNDNLLEELIIDSAIVGLDASNNNLSCIQVADPTISFPYLVFTDIGVVFNTNCNYSNPCNSTTAIQEHSNNKELLKVTDLLGRETKGKKNEPLFYIYDDGTVEKKIIIE